ncbi:helix-turn-helix domain-containing protein [Streptomyces sp. NPDC091377]|uniref:helix-turn-helix domain-containing protein n=1 Tax=Streptomyces sp. NPDC091377 TaxID=3365995 RepID=UPI00381B0BDA
MSAHHDDVERFAALLRGLKERTDRSYGSLARRLHMNTSTLHRYCAGDTVPLEFAPVERFAALCGAAPEERHELHRAWLLAVAARQRPRNTGTAAQETAKAEAAPAVAEAAGEAEAVGEAEAAAGTGAAAEPAPWFRRRRTVIATAAVCATLLATLGTLSGLPADRRPEAVGASSSSGSTPEVFRATGTPTPGDSTGPSVKGDKNSADGAGDGKGTGSPSASGAPRASGAGGGTSGAAPSAGAAAGSKDPAPAGLPFTWTSDSHAWALGCGHDYVIDRPPARVPPPPAAQDARGWATAQGAVHGRDTNVRITVQGRSATTVVLEALRVRVVGRAAPVRGNSYAMDQGCGGAITPRYFDVDLDIDRPIARAMPGDDVGTELPAVRMPYTVSSTDPEVLLVTGRTAGCACDWYLELDWSSQGRGGTVRIDDNGRPFRTSAIKGLDRYQYDVSGRDWIPYA